MLLLLLLRDSEKFIRLIAFREAREVVFFSFFGGKRCVDDCE
uniref:Uncharacterized protein n=1 Tax=Anopheles quadriannulatus TaxID=34691 RepID=A0A182XSX9_ANOQN